MLNSLTCGICQPFQRVTGLFNWGRSHDRTGACPACPVAPGDGTGVAPADGTGVKFLPC